MTLVGIIGLEIGRRDENGVVLMQRKISAVQTASLAFLGRNSRNEVP